VGPDGVDVEVGDAIEIGIDTGDVIDDSFPPIPPVGDVTGGGWELTLTGDVNNERGADAGGDDNNNDVRGGSPPIVFDDNATDNNDGVPLLLLAGDGGVVADGIVLSNGNGIYGGITTLKDNDGFVRVVSSEFNESICKRINTILLNKSPMSVSSDHMIPYKYQGYSQVSVLPRSESKVSLYAFKASALLRSFVNSSRSANIYFEHSAWSSYSLAVMIISMLTKPAL
jgi:hypothetical protein